MTISLSHYHMHGADIISNDISCTPNSSNSIWTVNDHRD